MKIFAVIKISPQIIAIDAAPGVEITPRQAECLESLAQSMRGITSAITVFVDLPIKIPGERNEVVPSPLKVG